MIFTISCTFSIIINLISTLSIIIDTFLIVKLWFILILCFNISITVGLTMCLFEFITKKLIIRYSDKIEDSDADRDVKEEG